jgi:hypothetical protein
MYSYSVLKRFIKDYSLPIQLVREPYYDYFIDLYNDTYNSKSKYQLLCDAVSQLNGEENFMSEYHRIKDKVLDAMKQNPVYIEFNNSKLEEYNIPNNQYSKHDIFNCANVRKCFVSIDLKKANFQAMKYYNKDLVFGFNTYEEFIGSFTDLEYMSQSKYIRQVIFGNLNPKKQIKIEQYLVNKILQYLLEYWTINVKDIKMVSADEIVFETDLMEFLLMKSYDGLLKKRIKENLDLDVDIEIYKLNQIQPFKFFVKEFVNITGYEIMCVPIVYFAQAYKMYNKMDINEYDLSFFYENQVARFLKPLTEMESNDEDGTDNTEIE